MMREMWDGDEDKCRQRRHRCVPACLLASAKAQQSTIRRIDDRNIRADPRPSTATQSSAYVNSNAVQGCSRCRCTAATTVPVCSACWIAQGTAYAQRLFWREQLESRSTSIASRLVSTSAFITRHILLIPTETTESGGKPHCLSACLC
jgi:hypothetical protein